MDIFLIVAAFLCLAVGLAGSVLPGLPGPPLSWIGLLLASLSRFADVSTPLLVIAAILAAAITVLDYVIPSLSTKRFGGSNYGIWGCNIGLVVSIVGLPFGPQGLIGVILWPFVGALVGEYLKCRTLRPALRAAWGAFLGFLGGTFAKLAYCTALLVIVIVSVC